MPDLLDRFETLTLKVWERLGIRQAGFWTTLIGPSNMQLTYLLAWESLAEREAKWTQFSNDPTWLAGRAESEKNGALIANVESSMLQPTRFSSVR
jgi:hypothetical protein